MVSAAVRAGATWLVPVAWLATGTGACTSDDTANGLPLCGDASSTIRYSFPGESSVDVCAPAEFVLRYLASGTGPGGPASSCRLVSARGEVHPASFPGGTISWKFAGYGSDSDWYAHAGRVAIGLDTDLTLTPGERYVSYATAGGGCRFEVRQAGAARGDREEVVLAESCPLIEADMSRPLPTIEALRMQAPVTVETANGVDPSQPPPFECPL